MEKGIGTESRGQALETQVFNGKTYFLYRGEKYFSKGTKRLHRVVWEFYNGKIPAGYQIHHKDGNPKNNDISNLECIPFTEHFEMHREAIVARTTSDKSIKHLAEIRHLASEWHRSKEGREWHRLHSMGERERSAQCTCQCCGKTFLSAYSDTKFCSNNCKSKWRRDNHIDDETRICVICGKEFRTNRYSKAVCCGGSCAAFYRNKRRKE